MNAVDDLWNVFLLVEVDQLKPEEIWKLNLAEESEKYGYIVGMSVLEFRVSKYAKPVVRLESFNDFSKGDSVAEGFLELDNRRYRPVYDIFDPFFCFSNMAEVLVGLQKLSLFVHPIPSLPAIPRAIAESDSTSTIRRFIRSLKPPSTM